LSNELPKSGDVPKSSLPPVGSFYAVGKHRNLQNNRPWWRRRLHFRISAPWAARGLKPRWLAAAIKSGKKLDDFLIDGASSSSRANGRKKARKPRK
jgi:hypothetical protein